MAAGRQDTSAMRGATRTRIFMWSGPRNVSTAVMYGFAQRGDTRVVDEPLYGHYLRVSGARHPGRDEVMAAMDLDGDAVMARLVDDDWGRPILFAKHMAHHLRGVDTAPLARARNFLLIRDPRYMLPSLAKVLPEVTLSDTGLERQVALVRMLEARGQTPFCVDAKRLLMDPPGVLAECCTRLGIGFDAAMLTWAAGPRPEDGVWARHWYANVHRSTGFAPWRPSQAEMPRSLRPLYSTCRKLYEFLLERALPAT
jgi:hypothetical protein